MAFDNINNYFEKLVLDEIQRLLSEDKLEDDTDFLSDIACVALNQLPARYVRHNVDMVFYMTLQERQQMEQEVQNAVTMAIKYVNQHRGDSRPETITG